MGQSSSSTEIKTAKVNDEKDADIWSTVIHVSDRDVLVQDIGQAKKEKVKLDRGRKHAKMDNVHLANAKRLEGLPSFKKRNAMWLPKRRRSQSRYPTGVVNDCCSAGCDEISVDEKNGARFSRECSDGGSVDFVGDKDSKSLVNLKH